MTTTPPVLWRLRPVLLAALAALAALSAASCAPAPRDIACDNDGECQRLDRDLTYCLGARCVECISHASCGDGNQCIDGKCASRCGGTRGCPPDEVCHDGTCEAG